MTTVVLCSNLSCEIGASAMYKCLDEKSHVVSMKIPDAKSFETTSRMISLCEINPVQIVMVGTYWLDCLEQLLEKYKDSYFIIYCFGQIPKKVNSKISYFCGGRGVGPAQFIFDLAKKKNLPQTFVKLFEKNYSHIIKLIDDRIYNKNIVETQPFYTGFFNYDSMDLTLFEKFTKLFQGEYDFDDIIKSGRSIVASQVQMANERVVNNSKEVTLHNGVKAVLTEGPELINLTHDALHKKYPSAQVSLVVSLKFGTKNDELAYSIRSFDDQLNASHLAQKINGDGNQTAAGGRLSFTLPIPF